MKQKLEIDEQAVKLSCALDRYMHVRTPEDHALIEAAARDYLVLRGQLRRILK